VKKLVSKKGKKTSSKGRIDAVEGINWAIFTIIYSLFIAILSGIVKTTCPDILYIWGIPLDIGQGVWVFGIAFWGIISLFLNVHYKKN